MSPRKDSTAVRARRHRVAEGAPLLEGLIRPSGHTSVMAGRAATAPEDLDYFPTPPWAARAGGELITRLDPLARTCWEPACGGGHMVHGLSDYFVSVYASDLHEHAWPAELGEGVMDAVDDFLEGPDAPMGRAPDWIVTNPPFKLGEAFVRAAWPRARRGVAMLLRLSFLEGGARHRLHYADCPLGVFAQFAERVPMVKGRWDPEASSATAYGWFIFPKPDALPGLSPVDGMWRGVGIPPGTKARLTRESDVRLFGEPVETPLFEETT